MINLKLFREVAKEQPKDREIEVDERSQNANGRLNFSAMCNSCLECQK